LKPEGLREGQRQAMAGRFTPSIFRSRVIDISISAPVLPQETATGASPARTASIADHMEVLLAMAQHRGRLFVHPRHVIGVTDLAFLGKARAASRSGAPARAGRHAR
jgi:hypothetical protein